MLFFFFNSLNWFIEFLFEILFLSLSLITCAKTFNFYFYFRYIYIFNLVQMLANSHLEILTLVSWHQHRHSHRHRRCKNILHYALFLEKIEYLSPMHINIFSCACVQLYWQLLVSNFCFWFVNILLQKNDASSTKRNENDKNTHFIMKSDKKNQKEQNKK